MSMPEFPVPNPDLTREQALNMILVSIALEETALSHIIEAEREKIESVLDCLRESDCHCDVQNVLLVNNSAARMLERVLDIQMILKNKMDMALEAMPKPCPCLPCPCLPEPCPCPPEPCPCPPEPCPCCHCPPEKYFSVFKAPACRWSRDGEPTLVRRHSVCEKKCSEHLNNKIRLPQNGRFLVSFNFELEAPPGYEGDVFVQLTHSTANRCENELFPATGGRGAFCVFGSTIMETRFSDAFGRPAFILRSACDIRIKSGRVSVAEL